MNNETRIRIAIQKSGRLSDASLKLISQAGIKLARSKDQLIAYGNNYPIDVLLTRDDDIPTLLNEGTCDIGIMGYNIYNEFKCSREADKNNTNIDSAMDLPFGECRLSFASPYDSEIKSLSDCRGTKIATSYPATVNSYLKKMDINATCIEFKGSVEIAPKLGTCNLICDLVSTGTTLKANGLVNGKGEELTTASAAHVESVSLGGGQAGVNLNLQGLGGLKLTDAIEVAENI